MSDYWAVVQTETQREHTTRILLMRDGLETYAPRIKINRKRVALLFPSYVFTRIINDRWYKVRWTPGVVRILMNGDQPAHLRDEIVAQLRKREVKGVIRLPPKTPKLGSRMRILRGPFAGHIALFDGMTSAERERVLLDLLGQKVAVELPKSDCEVLDVAS